MRNKLTKFLTSECPPKGMRQFAKTWKYAACMLLAFILGFGQMWAAGTALADLNFSGITAAPSAYTYSSSNTPSYNASQGPSGDKRSCMLVGNGGKGQTPTIESTGPITSEGKRWMAFCPAEDCDLEIVCTGNGKIFKLYDKDHYNALTNVDATTSHLSSFTGTSSWETWEITGLKAGTWYVLSATSSSSYVTSMTFTAASSTPVCPSGLSITSKNDKTAFLEGDAIELTAALTAGNGTITYQWYKGGTAEGNKLTGKTAAKLEIASCVEGDAGDYYCVASKSECSDAVNADAFTITVAHNPCTTHHWFVATADATANSVTNWNGFTNTVTGSNNQNNSVTIDGTTYTLTKRTGSTGGGGTILGFTIPANKAGTLYGYMKSSGTAARILSLKKGDDVVKTNTEIVDGNWTLITIDAIAPGTYTLSPDQNVQVQMFVLKICDATFRTITLEYADGETADGSLSALDGAPATKPTDPTWAHHRFDGWYSGATPYDWTANVTGDLTLTAHWTQLYTVTYEAGDGTATGDAPTEADKAATETFTVAANPFTVAGKDFVKWNDGTNDYAPGATYTVGTDNVVLTAQWKAAADKYTVIFKDGTTELGTKLFDVTTNPSDADIDKTKALNTFAAWQKEGVDIALDDAFWATVAKDAVVTLTARWTKAYASSVDLEGLVEASGTGADWQKYLSDHGYAFSTSNVSLDEKKDPSENKPYDNWPYQGLKAKVSGAYVEGNIEAGKLVIIKLGHMAADATVTIDGVAQDNASGLDAAEPAGAMNYYYLASEGLLHYETTNAGACILKAITITDPFTVTFDANGGDDVTSLNGTPSVTLPSATKGTESFLGWFDADDNKIGEAGETYTPTANITLKAHWEAISTDARLASITFSSDAGTLAPAFDPEVTEYTYTMPYGTTAIPIITGATKANANAQAPVIGTAAAAWGNAQTVKGVAQSGAEKTYTITMKLAPKDGVEIIGVVTTGGTNKTVSGLYKGDASVNLDSNKKIGGDKYIYVTLASGYTFEETDVLVVDVEAKSDLSGGNKALEITTGVGNIDGSVWKSIAFEDYTTGENIIPLTGIAANQTSIGLKRSSNQNAFINGLKVYRPMNPVLTAITINDRDGVIDPLDDKHFTVTIPNDANLASLTIVPTIVRNAPHATTPEQVMTNSGAWVLTEDGNNTYRIMDKDGDYTDYTITLIRDVLKYQVSFDTNGGSSIDPVEVVANGYLTAGQVPADPTKAENVFLGWAETAGGDVVADITAIQITDDKTFFAKWEAEPDGIKLFSNTGELNTAKFITPAKADDPIVIDAVPYPTLVAFGSNRTSLGGAKQADVVLYSATTNQTKIKFQLYNTNSSAKKAYLWMVEEGATESGDPIEIEVDGETMVTTGYYTFNSNKNRSFYLTSGSKADIKVLQAKVIESGTDIHQFGQAGYELNFNKGRIAVAASATVQFEGASIHSNEDYSVLNSSNFKPKTYIQFNNAVANTIVKITKSSSNKYYVTNDLDNKGEGYSTDAEVELTTTGTWYIGSVNTGSVAALSKIEFIAPKCAEPEFNALANSDLCEGDAFVALNGTATVDAGTPIYQWYNADGDVELTGETNPTYTPTADGSYYVIATNQLAGYSDNVKKSDLVSVTHFASAAITTAPLNQRGVKEAVVTLSVAATGKNLSYEWFTCDNEAGENPVAVVPAAIGTSLNVTITEGMSQWYKVVVTSDCGNASATAKVEQFVPVVQANVSASTTWNWTEAASVDEIKLTDATTPEKNEGFVMANGAATVYNNANFESDKLYLEGEYIIRKNSGNLFFQGQTVKFNTTVAGLVRVTFSNTGGNPSRELYVNGVGTGFTSANGTLSPTGYIEVPAGEVSITAYLEDKTSDATQKYVRISKIEFLAENTARARALTVGNLGTTCIENACIVRGAEIYEIKGKNDIGKIVFDQLDADEVLEAGHPYVMVAKEANIRFFNTIADPATEPYDAGNGLIGTFEQKEFAAGEASEGLYFFKDHALWAAKETGMTIPAYRCYLNMNAVGTFSGGAPAPGRRRITMDVHGQNAATGIGNVQGDEVQSTKVLINGQLFILRGEKMYDATGRMVK